jgi:hypothetical protein
MGLNWGLPDIDPSLWTAGDDYDPAYVEPTDEPLTTVPIPMDPTQPTVVGPGEIVPGQPTPAPAPGASYASPSQTPVAKAGVGKNIGMIALIAAGVGVVWLVMKK